MGSRKTYLNLWDSVNRQYSYLFMNLNETVIQIPKMVYVHLEEWSWNWIKKQIEPFHINPKLIYIEHGYIVKSYRKWIDCEELFIKYLYNLWSVNKTIPYICLCWQVSFLSTMFSLILGLFFKFVTGEKLWLDRGSNPKPFADRANTTTELPRHPGHITNNFSP